MNEKRTLKLVTCPHVHISELCPIQAKRNGSAKRNYFLLALVCMVMSFVIFTECVLCRSVQLSICKTSNLKIPTVVLEAV